MAHKCIKQKRKMRGNSQVVEFSREKKWGWSTPYITQEPKWQPKWKAEIIWPLWNQLHDLTSLMPYYLEIDSKLSWLEEGMRMRVFNAGWWMLNDDDVCRTLTWRWRVPNENCKKKKINKVKFLGHSKIYMIQLNTSPDDVVIPHVVVMLSASSSVYKIAYPKGTYMLVIH
jgi:hypothetical protein